jgi:hypothetical protein
VTQTDISTVHPLLPELIHLAIEMIAGMITEAGEDETTIAETIVKAAEAM